MNTLNIKNLHAKIGEKHILKGINLKIKSGEIHVLMGPNGSGKTTLSNTLMGHPKYKITKGEILLNKIKINDLDTHKRANLGLFMSFQNPLEIPGITLGNFLRLAQNSNIKANDQNAEAIGPIEFMQTLRATTKKLKIEESFIGRSVNTGFSGGEKKKSEIMQMAILKPKFAILDEIDSGLDIDALKIVAEGIKKVHEENKTGIILITHYQRILNYISPNYVHIISNGKIVKSGNRKLAHELEKKGYESFI